MISTRFSSTILFFFVLMAQYFANAVPVLGSLPKRQIVTRMHTASTTNVVTDFYSTTTEVDVAPTVEFIISGDATLTTTLPRADGSTPTGNPTTTLLLTIKPQQNYVADPSSTTCATTVANGTPKGTVYVSAVQASQVGQNANTQSQQQASSTYFTSNLVASTSVLPQQAVPSAYSENDQTIATSVTSSSPQTSTTSSLQTSVTPASTTSNAQETSGNSVSSSFGSSAPLSGTQQIYYSSSTAQTDFASNAQQTTSTTTSSSSTSEQAVSSSVSQTSTLSSSAQSSSSGGLTSAPTALVYSPYNNDNTCKDSSSVYQDMEYIKSRGVSKIRIYGTDCNSLETITSAAQSLGMTINQGMWITSAGVDSIDSSIAAILSYGESNGWDLFDVLTIGNEAILNNYCSVDELLGKISSVRTQFENAGFKGKFTTSEPPVSFENNPKLCQDAKIDFVGINSHAYFDVNSSADSAGTFVKGQLELIQQVCGTNNVEVTETGYPSGGDQNGGNYPSAENQIKAVQNILNEMGQQVTVLSTYNDYWKQPGPYGIEQFFGVGEILPTV
ncbi:LANO_0F07866g1_1 [Lachancea nothofagi CBS 11611]|uniref:LANO_0F07866g1_1 n=1 Tax=Lachancea nothofagi CBS 11611 TaxID=1266666 RepID=A0A1G4K972_9SACH|nr:LANO_0F07866g1_1 [Lachancea nothofagi CBS 11611]